MWDHPYCPNKTEFAEPSGTEDVFPLFSKSPTDNLTPIEKNQSSNELFKIKE